MNSDIVPHIFRLLLQYFNDPTSSNTDDSKLEDYWSNADDWIDCWVGCAAIVVRHETRVSALLLMIQMVETKSNFADLGPLSKRWTPILGWYQRFLLPKTRGTSFYVSTAQMRSNSLQ